MKCWLEQQRLGYIMHLQRYTSMIEILLMNSKTYMESGGAVHAPEGYRALSNPSNFNTLCGPYYERVTDGLLTGITVRIEDKHLNQRAITHGGMLMTMADLAMGDAVASAYGYKAGFVTVSMNSDFLKPAALGDWVEARPVVQRKGQRMAFAECLIYVKDTLIFKASAVFAVVERRA